MRIIVRVRGETNGGVRIRSLHGHVDTGRGKVDDAGLNGLLVSCFPHMNGAQSVQSLRESCGESAWHVLHNQDGYREICGKQRKNLLKRLWPSGGSSDGHYRRRGRGEFRGGGDGTGGGLTWDLNCTVTTSRLRRRLDFSDKVGADVKNLQGGRGESLGHIVEGSRPQRTEGDFRRILSGGTDHNHGTRSFGHNAAQGL